MLTPRIYLFFDLWQDLWFVLLFPFLSLVRYGVSRGLVDGNTLGNTILYHGTLFALGMTEGRDSFLLQRLFGILIFGNMPSLRSWFLLHFAAHKIRWNVE